MKSANKSGLNRGAVRRESNSAPQCDVCHTLLAPSRSGPGRHRVTCSDRCRRQRDFRQRRLRRRIQWIAAWRAELDAGRYPRAFVQSMLRKLQAERRTVERAGHGEAGTDASA
jgi:hypothetical protein